MKFNWGTGILLVIIVFVGTLLSMVYFSFQQKINLVTEDYYPKTLKYQEQIDRIKNTNSLAEKPKIELKGKTIFIRYPNDFSGESHKGTIHVYRPSDFELDHKFKIEIKENKTQNIEINELIKGLYKVKLTWSAVGKEFYFEENIHVK